MAPKRNQVEAFSLSSSSLANAASRAQGSTGPSHQTSRDRSRIWQSNGQVPNASSSHSFDPDPLSPYGGSSDAFSVYDDPLSGGDLSDFDQLLTSDQQGAENVGSRPSHIPMPYLPTNTIAPQDLHRSPPYSSPSHLLTPAITSSPSPKLPQVGFSGLQQGQNSSSIESFGTRASPLMNAFSTPQSSNVKQDPWTSTSSIGSRSLPKPDFEQYLASPSSHPATQQYRPSDMNPGPGGQRSHVTDENTAFSQESSLEQAPMREGIRPSERAPLNESEIPTIEEEQKQRDVKAKNETVEQWLNRTTNKSSATPLPSGRAASAIPETQSSTSRDLFDEDSDEDEVEDWDKRTSIVSPPTPRASHDHVLQTMAEASSGDADPTSLSKGFRTMNLWSDSPHDDDAASVKQTPETSTRAIERFTRRAREVETISIAATYAPSRRGSRADTLSIFSSSGISERKPSYVPFEDPPIPEDVETDQKPEEAPRKDSLFNKVSRSLSRQTHRRRAESNETVKTLETSKRPSVDKTDSQGSIPSVRKTNSLGQSSGQVQPDSTTRPGLRPDQSSSFDLFSGIRRPRSRSDLANRRNSALAQKWAASGGPPVAFVNTKHRESLLAGDESFTPPQFTTDPFVKPELPHVDTQSLHDRSVEADDDDEDVTTPTTTTGPMELPVSATYEGFKDYAKKMCPRIEPFLLERLAQEQVKRYKVLIDMRIEHHQRVINNQCDTGQRCADLGTGPKYLRPPKGRADKEEKSAIFQISQETTKQEIEHLNRDETPQLATFPDGIPPPPIKQLPAEFECPICFKIKRLQKPSDWSKHCFEDLYPFLCSFSDCAEPKSFNRKADWSRHESERHLKLETWTCCYKDCAHVCHRRDNFIQHLVRAHKLAEPKVAGNRRRTAEDDSEVSRLAKDCHHETPKRPEEQKCSFCGTTCNAWKKLAVHLANHMKQLNLPMLALIERENISQYFQPINGHSVDTAALMQWRRQASIAQNYPVPVGTPSTYLGSMSPQPAPAQNHANGYANGTIIDEHGQAMVHPAFQGSYTFPGSKNLQRHASPYDMTISSNQSFGNQSQYGDEIDPHASMYIDPLEDIRSGQRTPKPSTYPPPYGTPNNNLSLNTEQQFYPTTSNFDNESMFTSPIFDDRANGNDMTFNQGMSNGMTPNNIPNNGQYYGEHMSNDQDFMAPRARNAQYNSQLRPQPHANAGYRDNRMAQASVYYDANDFDDYSLSQTASAPQFDTGMYNQQAVPGQQSQYAQNNQMYGQGQYGS